MRIDKRESRTIGEGEDEILIEERDKLRRSLTVSPNVTHITQNMNSDFATLASKPYPIFSHFLDSLNSRGTID